MNKKCLFSIVNVLLVAIVGLLVGLFCKNIFSTQIGIGAFVCFLIALCIPAVVFFLASKAGNTAIVLCVLLMVAELVINIIFMAKPTIEPSYYAITQASVVGAFLVAMLIVIGVGSKKED